MEKICTNCRHSGQGLNDFYLYCKRPDSRTGEKLYNITCKQERSHGKYASEMLDVCGMNGIYFQEKIKGK